MRQYFQTVAMVLLFAVSAATGCAGADTDAAPWGGEVLATRPLVDLSSAVTDAYPDRDVVISMEVVPRLPGARGPVALKFRFQLTYAGGRWKPAEEGFTANIYNYHWPTPPRFSNIRITGRAIGDGLSWTERGGLKGTVRWRFAKPFRQMLAGGVDRHVPDSAWELVPQEGEVAVDLPLNPAATKPRPTGLPPWWLPTVFGFNYYGTFTYAAGEKEFTGEAALNIVRRPIAGKFVPWTAVEVAKAEGGVMFKAMLPKRRVAAEAGGFAKYRFQKPLDASGFDGVRLTVETNRPRRDVGVAIGFKEGTGAWFYSDAACPLTKSVNTWVLPFDRLVSAGFVLGRGFFDPNMAFDADAIGALAVGAHNPFGAGDVRFVVKKIELVRWSEHGYGRAPAKPVTVEVDAYTAVRRNGVVQVPEELMGVHVVGGFKPEDFPEDYFRRINVRHGRPLLHTSFTEGGGVGVPHAAALHSLGLQDAAVICYTWGNLWGRAPWMDGADLRPGVRAWGERLAEKAWKPGDEQNPLRRAEFWNEPFMWGRHINAYDPRWKDRTQHGYIPGELGAKQYAELFIAAVDAAKAVNPHLQIGGMSTPAFGGDRYSVFWDYVRHFIDACAEKIDFLTEHHYGGNPASYAASYEVVTAYCDTKHGRRIPIINTECNDLVDTPTYGDEGLPAPWSPHADDLIRFRYNVRDVMTMIAECPDKARGRAVHALWNGKFKKKGEEHAFEILNNVAGTILDCKSSDPNVPAIACRNGDTVVVLVLNDSPHSRKVKVKVDGHFKGVNVQRVIFDAEKGTQFLTDVPPPPMDGAYDADPRNMAAYEAVRYTFRAPGHKVKRTRLLTEHFAEIHMAQIEPGKTREAKVHWRDKPAEPAAAWLRVVTEGVEPGEGFVRIAGHQADLPASAPGAPLIHDIAVPAEAGRRAKSLVFGCRDETGAETGYRVLMAALYIEQ